MFRCSRCGRNTIAGEKQKKITVERRERQYPSGSVGWEIVKEVAICNHCQMGIRKENNATEQKEQQ